ncbi:S-adenosyl-L-methionine-dependent methyltransferase [Crucibulum laeve]|uniref:S-adenosyl-L-methionine-dependent methyltransferase n=1 Tax=Crucibulum laeve TaxID=68775 RepID=A0A5C3MHR0_9AGAR|nr:S-adenosyl-L-methionine-dependent methyltransferase [Crucibulum laeve]
MPSTTPSDTENVDSSGWSASMYNKNAHFVYSAAFTAAILELLAVKPGEKILDVGCGSGEVSLEIERVVNQQEGGLVVGTDVSESMIAKSKENGLRYAFVCDAQALELPSDINAITNKFDAVFSNAVLHWCKRDPAGVITSVKKVLKPGGRFVGEMGGFMNCIGIRSALHQALLARGYDPVELDPWYFPSTEDYEQLLRSAGFDITYISLIPRITPLPTGLYGWIECFARNSLLRNCSDEEAKDIMTEVEEKLRIDCQDSNGKWAMVYIRLRFVGILK